MLEENFAEKVDELFKQWDKPDTPGCALAIIKDGKIVYKKGYGMADLEHNVPITPKTIFTPGSISKQFTAMCILLLVEQKKISLDDDIRKYLPKFPDYGHTITIRHLIHHTSGIRDYGMLVRLKGMNTLEMTNLPMHEVLRIVFKQKELNFTPGEDGLYCNSGYVMLAAIIENVTGKTLREFAEVNIFKPLGMKNTNFIDDNKYIIKNRAFGYIPDGKKGYFNAMVSHRHCGPGGVYSNVEDLFLWDQNFQNNKLGKGRQNLIEIMCTPFTPNNVKEVGYAFGLIVGRYKGLKTIWHNGGIEGYHAQYITFPKYKFSVIILANVSNLMPELLANKIADLFLGQFIKPEQPKISVDSTIFQNYIGKYFSDFLGIVSISCKNNDLMIQASLGFPELKLVAESETSFFRELPNIRITFQKDDYSEFILYDPGNEFRIKRIESSKPALKELKEYVGRYYSEEIDQIYTLTINNDSLYIANFEMVLAVIDKFITDWGIFRFKRENNGNIEGFKLNAGRVRNLWFKRS
ncbi:MAG: serine hydrolase domain-containing protein [Promethearchaeota archaeon]|jgi:CubicO group peptidase (beta-lactamase class C family)